jgi:hypothetical protein
MHLDVSEVEADVIAGVGELAHQALRVKSARLAPDELRNPGQRIGPQCGIERRIVNAADDASQLIVFAHVTG